MKAKLDYSKLWLVLSFFVVYQLIFSPEMMLGLLNNQIVSILIEIIMFCLAAIFTAYTYRYVHRIADWNGDFIKEKVPSWLIFTLSILLLLLLQWSNTFLISQEVISNTQNQTEILKELNHNPVFTLIAGIVVAPVLEELIFRGLFYKLLFEGHQTNQIKKRVLLLVILANSLVFAIPHLNTISLDIVPYMLMAAIFSVNFIYYKKISIPIILHIFNNLIASFIF